MVHALSVGWTKSNMFLKLHGLLVFFNPIPNALVCQHLLPFQHLLFCSSSLFTPNLVHVAWSCCVIILPHQALSTYQVIHHIVTSEKEIFFKRINRNEGPLLATLRFLLMLCELFLSVRFLSDVLPVSTRLFIEQQLCTFLHLLNATGGERIKRVEWRGCFEVSYNLYISFNYHLHLSDRYRTSVSSPSKSLCSQETHKTIENLPAVTL